MNAERIFKAIAFFGLISLVILLLSGLIYLIDKSIYTDLVDKFGVIGFGGIFLVFPLMSVVIISNYEDFPLELLFSSWKHFILSALILLGFLPFNYLMVSEAIVEVFNIIPFYRHERGPIDIVEMSNYQQYVAILAMKIYAGVTFVGLVIRLIRIHIGKKEKMNLA